MLKLELLLLQVVMAVQVHKAGLAVLELAQLCLVSVALAVQVAQVAVFTLGVWLDIQQE